MAKTKITDVIVPSVFAPYILERTAELSELQASGIVGRDAEFDALANGGGKTVDLPFWKDLSGASEVLSDSAALTPAKITSGQDTGAIHNRGKAWSSNDLAKWLSGDDPQATIGDLIAAWWNRDDQTTILAILKGLFDDTAGVLKDTHRSKIAVEAEASYTESTKLHGETFIDGVGKLGDSEGKVQAVIMHSDVERSLRKRDLIDFVPDSEGKSQIRLFQGRRVLVDDGMPKRAGTTDGNVYTTYLFGPGAIGLGEATLEPEEAVEMDRVVLEHDTVLVNRRRFILHPRGVRWTGTPAGASPTNTEMETAANWSKVYTDKNIRLLAIVHNI